MKSKPDTKVIKPLSELNQERRRAYLDTVEVNERCDLTGVATLTPVIDIESGKDSKPALRTKKQSNQYL